ncbi:SLC13 family permease [Deinococcus lacus]|uniref:SLC13 family permease n=1 Tax=Deinococcus lacus TaxID=392561 RepID=A0ABW1Y8E2_9DEIO
MGDIVLIQGPSDRLSALGDQVTVLGDLTEQQRDFSRAPLAAGLFVAAIAAASFGWLPLAPAVLTASAIALALRLLSTSEAYAAIEWPVIVLVGSMLAFGAAFESTGAAALVSGWLSGLLAPLGGLGALAVVYLVTLILTQPMSNQAAALVVLPLAAGAAQSLGYDPRPFVIAVTVAASNSFLTPLEPSCLLVYGPGRYRFSDFIRVGAGLTLISFAVTMLIVPVIWPLQP